METGHGEAETLRAAQKGDDLAFGRLVRPCMDPAYRLALRILGRREEAEDAVQTALLRAWRGLPQFRGDAKFSTWLYRIVWRTCIDRARRQEFLPLAVEARDPSRWHDPEDRWESIELRDEVERVLMRLPVRYRAVLTLFYIEDLPIREIAEILLLPAGTVKTHLHRARRAFRAQTEGESNPGGGW